MAIDQKIILGQQFVKAIDSILANIAEGYGRYHYLEKIKFFYIARASLVESLTWLELLKERQIISPEQYNKINSNLNILHAKLNAYIKHCLNKKYSNS